MLRKTEKVTGERYRNEIRSPHPFGYMDFVKDECPDTIPQNYPFGFAYGESTSPDKGRQGVDSSPIPDRSFLRRAVLLLQQGTMYFSKYMVPVLLFYSVFLPFSKR